MKIRHITNKKIVREVSKEAFDKMPSKHRKLFDILDVKDAPAEIEIDVRNSAPIKVINGIEITNPTEGAIDITETKKEKRKRLKKENNNTQ